MRTLAVIAGLGLLVAACGGTGQSPALPGMPAKPAMWPLRGTPASDAEAIARRPIVVKIAADPAARPQSGLADADLVLEIPVEGGVTRFAVVFHSKDPAKVGPVRSARQSDLNYLSTLRAIVVHVGASEPVTKMVRDAARSGGFVDVDEFEKPAAFERTTDRAAPYNAYTSGAKAREAAGATGKVSVPALTFGEPPAGGGDGASLTVPHSDAVRYEYAATRGAYHRTYVRGGGKTLDGSTEVLPENVVVIKTEVKEIAGTADSTGAPSVDYRATGSGPVVVLRDGKRFEGTWHRQGDEMYSFKDASGAVIALKPGLTWIHIVPDDFTI